MPVLVTLCVLLAVLGAAHLALAARFQRLAQQLAAAIPSAAKAPPVALPPAVHALAARAGVPPADTADDAPARRVELRQDCEMRLSRGAPWQAMTAVQTIGVHSPGFVWAARMAKGPLTFVRVIDALAPRVASDAPAVPGAHAAHVAHGALEGRLHVRLLGSIPIANARGGHIDRGEAMRYLAELPWAPDALRHNAAITWNVIDSTSVEASMALPDGPATVRFTLDAHGDIVQVDAERPTDDTDAQGAPVWRHWRCAMRDYTTMGGRRIPGEGEAGYVYADGYEAYWRGRITAYTVV